MKIKLRIFISVSIMMILRNDHTELLAPDCAMNKKVPDQHDGPLTPGISG